MLDDWAIADWESQSACEISEAGAERYCEDPTTRETCLGIAWPKGPPELWIPGEPPPERLCEHVERGRRFIAYNVAFDFNLWRAVRTRDPRWPELKLEQTECLMSRGRTLSLPGKLERMCSALRLSENKDKDGQKSLKKIMKPRKDGTFWTPETAPEDFQKLYAYAKQDVLVERMLHEMLPPLTDSEREIWLIDQEINQRGVYLDVPNLRHALELLEAEKLRLRELCNRITGYNPTQVDKLKEWLNAHGCKLDKLDKGAVARVLEDTETLAKNPELKIVLEARQQASKTSNEKFGRMLTNAGADQRGRGQYAFYGANTGRWAGRGWQPQNLKRQTKTFKAKNAEDVIAHLSLPNPARTIRFEYGSLMEPLSLSARGFIKAPPGRRLVVADYSNIEGRITAWVSGEDWKLEAFRRYDTFVRDAAGNPIPDGKGDFLREGPDLYKLAFANSFGVPVETVNDDDQRQTGKVQELGLGFAGSVGALLKMCATYMVDPTSIAVSVKAITDPEKWATVLDGLPKMGSKMRHGLDPDTWTGLKIVVEAWRAAHPATTAMWSALMKAAHAAVENPGVVTAAGPIRYKVEGDFLKCRLPSGRAIYYPYPEFKKFPSFEWSERKAELQYLIERFNDPGNLAPGTIEDLHRELAEHEDDITWETQLTYWGEATEAGGAKIWKCRQFTRSIAIENVVQAIAADCQRRGMKNCKADGFPIVMHSHDEIVCELEFGKGSVTELAHKMCAQDSWAYGLPIVAAGWEGDRYRK